MAAAKSQPGAASPDTVPVPSEVYVPVRINFPLEVERQQSGGLLDDPTESGEPVRDKESFTLT